MIGPIAAEPGSELFRDPDGEGAGLDLSFGPIAGGQPRWSLVRRDGRRLERAVLDESRPSRRRCRLWLTDLIGEARAMALIGRVGRFDLFYADYYAARPDLLRGHLVAVA